jgi:hypothetical protein
MFIYKPHNIKLLNSISEGLCFWSTLITDHQFWRQDIHYKFKFLRRSKSHVSQSANNWRYWRELQYIPVSMIYSLKPRILAIAVWSSNEVRRAHVSGSNSLRIFITRLSGSNLCWGPRNSELLAAPSAEHYRTSSTSQDIFSYVCLHVCRRAFLYLVKKHVPQVLGRLGDGSSSSPLIALSR